MSLLSTPLALYIHYILLCTHVYLLAVIITMPSVAYMAQILPTYMWLVANRNRVRLFTFL